MNEIKRNPMYHYLMVLTIGSMVGLQSWRILFNNFAVEVAHLEGSQIGMIQSVREIPGILALLSVFVLMVIKEHRLTSLSTFLTGLGLAATGFFPSYWGLLLSTFSMSLGFHFFQVSSQSLMLQYFEKRKTPLIIGKLRSLAAGSNVIIAALIYFVTPLLNFTQTYLLIGCIIMAAGIWGVLRDPSDKDITPQYKKIIFRKKYWLYYLLRFLAGTRRQTFVAFALFLLVKQHHLTIQMITILFIANNILNFFLSPYVGKSISRFGERTLLSIESFCLFFVFIAFAILHFKYVLIGLYIFGSILFYNIPPIAIRTYFQKVADPKDIAATMAAGSTINHISTSVAPAIGGILWMIDYRIPFIFVAVLCIISFAATQKIQTKGS
jgi:predicted MFS family arabinose efflux permease